MTQQVIGGGLLILSALAYAAKANGWFSGWRSAPKPSEVNSDEKPPEGFIYHLQTIRKASPEAPADVREQYYFDGLTRAETLAREVERLSGKKPQKEVAS